MRLQAADALMRLQRTLKPLTLRSVGGYRILVKITVMPDLVPACEYRLYRFWVGFKAPPGNEVEKGPRDDRWYLNLMAPNTKGDKFAWLDPTSIYINDAAFSDLVDDLMNDTDSVSFGNYSGRTQNMEMRTPAFAPGTRVLLADQWVETGGTMQGAINLPDSCQARGLRSRAIQQLR